MILWLVYYMTHALGLKVPAVFAYSSTRMILAALTSLLFTIGWGPFFIRKLYELKTGQSIRVEDCPVLAQLHEKKKTTPTMGGVLILSGMLLSLLLWMDLKSGFTWILCLTTLWLGILGGWDDYLKLKFKNSKGLSGRKKLFWQGLLGVIIAFYLYCPAISHGGMAKIGLKSPVGKEFVMEAGTVVERELSTQQLMGRYFVPFYKNPVWILTGAAFLIGGVMIVFVLTGASNAVNLTDGLDGLAAGCLVMVAMVLALFAFFSNHQEMARYLNILYIEGSVEIGVYLFALIGACLGFLWYNGYPAQVFMGDVGSLSLGGIIGISAILLRREGLLALIGGIFVAEAISVILQVLSYRLRNKRRIFLCAPLHHHFEYKGWPETKVVLRFWIIGLLLAILGIASVKFQ